MRRLRGLLIVLRVLTPVLLVLGLALATWWTARNVVDATREYGRDLGAQLDEIKRAVDEANEGLVAIGEFVSAATDAADVVLTRVGELAEDVTIPLPDVEVPPFVIPGFDFEIDLPDFRLGVGELRIPIPGVGPLKDLAAELAEAGNAITEPMAKIAGLADVPPNLEQAAEDTAAYAVEIRTTMTTWLRVALVALVIALLAWLGSQARPAFTELNRGVGLMMGRPGISGATIADLERELARLQRQVAALRTNDA